MSNYPNIKLAARTKKALKRHKYVPIPRTTLLTEAGPAPGTIWTSNTGDVMVVDHLEPHEHEEFSIVRYADEGFDYLDGFMQEVEEGRYILIGTCHPIMSYSPHVTE
jgi:hypothetical protein